MRWAEFGIKRGVYHLAVSWNPRPGVESRWEPACNGTGADMREVGDDGDRYCTECLKAFMAALSTGARS